MSMRIAVGGIHIECSTYSSVKTSLEDFLVLRGADLPAYPYFQFLQEYPHTFVPTLYATAIPGGRVRREAYETLKQDFLTRLEAARPLDGLYLAMHGAMFVESLYDAEGDWISAARQVVGEDCLISASYDLHGNVSQTIVDQLDLFCAYRTAPHIDVTETQRRACEMLIRSLKEGLRPKIAWVAIPALFPGERTSTADEPAAGLYAGLLELDALDGVMDASLLVGYVWADEPRSTASAVLTGTSLQAVQRAAELLGERYWAVRGDFSFGAPVGTIAQCVDWALSCETHPVILADSGDNPTGGGVGDRADVVRELLGRGAQRTLVAGIADQPATDACYTAGEGTSLTLSMGGSLDPRSERIQAEVRVLHLHETAEVRDRQAVVQVAGITVVLTARRRPFHNLSDFTVLGLDPRRVDTLVVKSGYLSPELAPLARPNVMALSPGAVDQDTEGLPRHHLTRPTYPFNRDFSWTAQAVLSRRAGRHVSAQEVNHDTTQP